MNQSLNQFFQRNTASDLDSCAQEQIHLSGMIQRIGGMIVLDPATLTVVGASNNLGDLLPLSAVQALGRPLAQIHPDIAAELAGMQFESGVVHEILDTSVKTPTLTYDVITHINGGFVFLEFIPNSAPTPVLVRKRMRICSRACAQIMGARNLAEARQIAVDSVREIIGFDRVKIYRFLPDWSGAVEAESCADTMPSYLGLHFPESDIPAQVREMMTIIPYRFIGTVSDDNIPILSLLPKQTLDQTKAMTRSVSPMHTAYLRNMGVSATFFSTLKTEGRLWGLIACHAQEEQVVPVDSWSLVQEIGTTLMMRMQQEHRTETTNMITSLRRIENNFAAELRREGDVEQVIASMVPVLQEFLRADGFAFLYGNSMHTAGQTPPEDFIRRIVRWAQKGMTDNDQFQTTELHRSFPEAQEHIETCCGILIQPIVVHRVCQLIWFRSPITRKVEWAGKPDGEAKQTDQNGTVLGPRTSFDRWVREHRDQSLPWEPAELESAREIFKEFLDIIASQVLLKKENESLRQFAHAAAHDIKAPLRGIKYALDWMVEDGFEEKSVREHQHIASLSAAKLQRLTEALIELSLLSDQEPVFEGVSLGEVIGDVQDLVAMELKQTGSTLHVGELPKVHGSQNLLCRLFLNLISNALKYRQPDTPARIDVTCVQTDPPMIAVTDNGTGIDPKYAEVIFEPTRRLVSHNEVEGTGLGLAITRRIVELHQGRISLDTSYRDGARFIVELSGSA